MTSTPEALALRLAPRAFATGGNDKGHKYGADQRARCVVEGPSSADSSLTTGLETHLVAGRPRFDPDHPELPK
jgi:hypothetical protein